MKAYCCCLIRLLTFPVFIILSLSACGSDNFMQKNIMPGCENTHTENYSRGILPTWKAGGNTGYIVISSDPQYPRVNDDNNKTTDNEKLSKANLTAVFNDIAGFRKTTDSFVPVVINGDITEYGHGGQRKETQRLLLLLKGGVSGPLFFAGLGNHDYQNNVNNCGNNGCARDSICDSIQWSHQVPAASVDYSFNNPLHKGSFAWSVDIGQIHIVQLNNFPTYTRNFETGGFVPYKKRKFEITTSLTWLKKDLADARSRNQIILLNMHEPNGWTSSDFTKMINDYAVTAIFSGHYHGYQGRYNWDNFRNIPNYQSGALLYKAYLILSYDINSKSMSIYKVTNGSSYKNKILIDTIPLRS